MRLQSYILGSSAAEIKTLIVSFLRKAIALVVHAEGLYEKNL